MYDVAKLLAVFHAFVLGLLANLRNVYEIRSMSKRDRQGRHPHDPKDRDIFNQAIIECKSVKRETERKQQRMV